MLKTDLAQKIRTLAGLTDAERSDLLALLNEQKKYGLVWEEKPEQVEEDLRDKLPVLREVADRRITARRSQTGTVASSPSLSATPRRLFSRLGIDYLSISHDIKKFCIQIFRSITADHWALQPLMKFGQKLRTQFSRSDFCLS